MRLFTPADVFKLAITNERKESTVYSTVAKLTDFEELTEIFDGLAKEEKLHEEHISAFFVRYMRDGSLLNYFPKRSVDKKILGIIGNKKLLRKIAASSFDYLSIKVAVKAEQEVKKFYVTHKDILDNEECRQLFQWLIEWEESHHDLLSDLLKAIDDVAESRE